MQGVGYPRSANQHLLTALHAHCQMPGPPVIASTGDSRVGHHLLGCFESRFSHGHHQIADAYSEGNSIRLISFREIFAPGWLQCERTIAPPPTC